MKKKYCRHDWEYRPPASGDEGRVCKKCGTYQDPLEFNYPKPKMSKEDFKLFFNEIQTALEVFGEMDKQPIHPYVIYTTKQAAELMQVHTITIQRYIKSGKLKGFKFGRRYRISGSELLIFLGFKPNEINGVPSR